MLLLTSEKPMPIVVNGQNSLPTVGARGRLSPSMASHATVSLSFRKRARITLWIVSNWCVLTAKGDSCVVDPEYGDACTGVVDRTVIADGSCLGIGACWNASSSSIGENSCTSYGSCFEAKGQIGDGACTNQNACALALGDVGTNSCTSEESCRSLEGSAGIGSCNGIFACSSRRSTVGDSSCNGDEACRAVDLETTVSIGNNACNGDIACYGQNDKGTLDVCTDPKGDGTDVADGECNRDAQGDRTCCTPTCISDYGCSIKFIIAQILDIDCASNSCICNDKGRCEKGERPDGYTPAPAPLCVGTEACSGVDAATSMVGDGSCTADYACVSFKGNVEIYSCTAEKACYESQSSIGINSCTAEQACYESQGSIGMNSCTAEKACYESQGSIGMNSCTAEQACYKSQGSIGEESCTARWACEHTVSLIGNESCTAMSACSEARGTIGKNSCTQDKSCAGSSAAIGDNACQGEDACRHLSSDVTIGNNSCNTDYACRCSDPKGDGTLEVLEGECNRDADGDRTCCTPTCESDDDCKLDFTDDDGSADISCSTYECFCNTATSRCQKGSSGGAEMDPHFETLIGQKFDFQGECDLVLFRSSGGLYTPGGSDEDDGSLSSNLNVHIRTTIQDFYSYINMIGIEVGKNRVTIDNQGMCRINGIEYNTTTNNNNNNYNRIRGVANSVEPSSIVSLIESEKDRKDPFAVTLEHVSNGPAGPKNKFTVTTGPYGEALTIVVWDVFVSVTVTPAFHARWSNNALSSSSSSSTMTEGGMIARDMLDRQGVSRILDGTTMMDPSEWAREWQVRPDEDPVLFDTPRAPQYPEACVMPDPAVIAERHLANAALPEMANEACAHWGPPSKVKECVYDVIATGNLGLAAAF